MGPAGYNRSAFDLSRGGIVSSQKYLISTMGKTKYLSLPKNFRETIKRLDQLPSTPRPVTLKQIEEALK